MDVIGCLEHDPELGEPQGHRTFLQQGVVFKEVVPIANQVRALRSGRGVVAGCTAWRGACMPCATSALLIFGAD